VEFDRARQQWRATRRRKARETYALSVTHLPLKAFLTLVSFGKFLRVLQGVGRHVNGLGMGICAVAGCGARYYTVHTAWGR
jgi:hypothetical protein